MTLQHIYLTIKERLLSIAQPAAMRPVPVRINDTHQRINEDQFRTGPAGMKILHGGTGPF